MNDSFYEGHLFSHEPSLSYYFIKLFPVERLKFDPSFKHCNACININDTLTMTGDQLSSIDAFSKPKSWLFLGGLPQEHQKDGLPHKGFVGCMRNLKVHHK